MTRIGLLSDTHGRAEAAERAAKLLIEEGAELLIHLGDVGTREVLDALVHRLDAAGRPDPPVRIVFGNTDYEADALRRHARHLGIEVDDPVGRLVVDGKLLIFQHGHAPADMERALAEGVDFLCHGHTHVPRDERAGRTRIINPGALHRARKHTAALLDLPAGRLRFITVPPA